MRGNENVLILHKPCDFLVYRKTETGWFME